MAERTQPIRLSDLPGAAAAAVLLFLSIGTLGVVMIRAGAGAAAPGPADWAAVRFTLLQALLSALLSVLLAIPVARALARRVFSGRRLLVTLLGAPFILPVIVAVLGLLAVFGRNGLISGALGWLGLPPIQIYGLHGVVLAHVFFNLPLATRLILHGWLSIPAERFRLAASLAFAPRDIARTLEWPMLREIVPGTFMVVFLLCLTSFAVALTLGGGPGATTVELAIYQAFRFDFDLSRAALLAVIQFALGAAAATVAFWIAAPPAMGAGMDRVTERRDADRPLLRLQDGVLIVLAAAFLLLPPAMVIVAGLPALFSLPGVVWASALRSVCVALGSAGLMLALALPLALLVIRLGKGTASMAVEGTACLSIAASPLVIGTGLFILLFPVADPVMLALPVTAVVNAAAALPFALRALVPALRATEADYGRLADSLGMVGWSRIRLMILPRLRRPLGFATGLAAALSMGDLGVVALFADPDAATLPLQLFRLMGAYRMADAAGAALLLLALSLLLFWLFDRGGRADADP